MLLPCDIFERFFRGFPLLISTILMQCLLNVLASVFSSIVTTSFSTRVISLLPMKHLSVRKGLMNFQNILLLFIQFSVVLIKCFFKDFLRNNTHMFLFFLYANTGRVLIHFVFQFASCVVSDSFLKLFG